MHALMIIWIGGLYVLFVLVYVCVQLWVLGILSFHMASVLASVIHATMPSTSPPLPFWSMV